MLERPIQSERLHPGRVKASGRAWQGVTGRPAAVQNVVGTWTEAFGEN